MKKSAGQAPHVPFLVLVGETMERLSGGRHPSCVHRVKRSEATGRECRDFWGMKQRGGIWIWWDDENCFC